jgi:hypothetical protein
MPTDQPLEFHSLTFVPEGDDVLVGRPGTDAYAVLPADGAELLRRMAGGAAPSDAAAWYERVHGQSLDIDDFVASVAELGFVRADGEPAAAEAPPVGLQRLAQALFSWPALTLYAAVIGAWVLTAARHPELAPHARQVFFTRSAVLVQLLIVFGQMPWLFLHESAHVLAARRLGLPSELGFGTRLYFLVFETRIPSLLSVPRRRRYLVFVAGMLLDLLAISVLGLIGWGLRDAPGAWHVAGTLALAMAFPIVTRFAYQFLLFLQTDVYFVVATALGCYDLHTATRTLVANRIWRVLGRPERVRPAEDWTEHDLRVARWYAPLFAVGVGVMLAVWILALIPVMVGLVRMAAAALAVGPANARFWDAALFIAINAAQLGFFAYVSLRNRAQARRGARPAALVPQGELS